MKPFGFIREGAVFEVMNAALAFVTITRKKTRTVTFPIYTAEQLSEAVAAERERCAKVCKGVMLNEISAPADLHNDACEDCIRAIRSAAK